MRDDGIDVARGALLVGMILVHLISAHGTAPQVQGLHGWVGIFLISAGFVALAGYVIALKPGPAGRSDLTWGLNGFVHLLLVLFGYGVLFSLIRHGLALASGGSGACSARFGWTPPLRFDDLGILLPIAILQPLALVSRGRARWIGPGLLTLALGCMVLPRVTAQISDAGITGVLVGVLTRRSLTPFYTVTSFVAMGLMGAWLGRRAAMRAPGPGSFPVAILALAASFVMAAPPLSTAVLDRAYRAAGEVGGAAATLGYWTAAIALFVRGCRSAGGTPPSVARATLSRLGSNSLAMFVLHDLLLALDAFARTALSIPKGIPAVAVMAATNLVLLLWLCRFLERSSAAQLAAAALLLVRTRGGTSRSGAFTGYGAVALAGILAAYTGTLLARPDRELLVDDFEAADCPPWWTFGTLRYEREPADASTGHGKFVLAVRGEAPGMFAYGRGVFMDRDVGERRTLHMDVRGYGPGSGRLKFELSEDDNGNWEIEKDPRLYTPLYDDRFVYEMTVDWTGWRQLALPVEKFHDDNPSGGNNVFDPARDLTSGGLLEMQILFSPAPPSDGEIRIDLDNVRWMP